MKELQLQLCPLAHPNHPHNLSFQLINDTISKCFSCEKPLYCYSESYHYHCTICDVDFHNFCERFPRKILHPFHLQHPLFLTYKEHGNITDHSKISDHIGSYEAPIVNSSSSTLDPGMSSIFDNCTWCGNNILYTSHRTLFYRCSICSFCLDENCVRRIANLTIENPKGHHHSLVFFPRPLLVPCDACGLVNASEPSYACFQCNYMVHQSCVDLPRVIKITRHQHRLSYSPYLPPPNSICRVCYKSVDVKYGQYSCKEEDCSYVLHSKCATNEAIWDRKELEWEPEELGVNQEDIAPFKRIGDDLIQHFSHKHHLKLKKYNSVQDENKLCQACVLPIDLHDFYNCIECDYFLHQVCASLHKKVDHALHVHSLTLQPSHHQVGHALHNHSPLFCMNKIWCSACNRVSTGFQYKCTKENCKKFSFQIDARCILVPEYGTNKIHEHHLFIVPAYYNSEFFRCNGCKKKLSFPHLQCTLCEFSVCYECITIPNELHYKYDEHPLILCYGEDNTDGKYWCEECEKEVDPSEWFYTCNKCCTTIHRKCLFGYFVYMKPGDIYKDYYCDNMIEVLGNNSSTRPVCSRCEDRCRGSIYFKEDVRTFCSSCR